MKTLLRLACLATLTLPAFSADTVVTKSKHTDAILVPGKEKPAEVQTEITWFGKDRMRVDVGGWTTIVRWDQKKVYQINNEMQTYSVVELPFDFRTYTTTAQAKFMLDTLEKVTVTVTPTTETMKVKDWNTTKHVLTMTVPKRGTFTESIWVTNDVGVDTSAWSQMWGARMSLMPIGAAMAKECEKLNGFPVLIERAQTVGTNTFTGRDEVVSIEHKDAPEGIYEPPKDYAVKKFELADGAMKTPPPVEVELIPIKPEPESKDPVTPPPPAPK